MAFDPGEPRDPHGKWLKVAKTISDLPKGGHGNRTSITGIEVRRHQTGEVNVKIGGESRRYSSHEDAARAVINRKHVTPGTGKSPEKVPAASPSASANVKAPGGKLGGSGKSISGGSSGKRKGEMGTSDTEFLARSKAKASLNSDIQDVHIRIAAMGGYQKAAQSDEGKKLIMKLQDLTAKRAKL